MSFEKNFLDVMTLDEIRAKVNACHPGSWHKIMILDGTPITIDSTKTLYITETFNVRFKINYSNLPHIMLRELINLAETPEDVATCRYIYDHLKHKEIVLTSSVRELEKKEDMVRKGLTLSPTVSSSIPTVIKARDTICPSIVQNKNGSTTLTCYTSFRNTIKSVKGGFEFEELSTHRRYFLKENDTIVEIFDDKTDPKFTAALATGVTLARTNAKKKDGGPSAVFTPKITNILHIW